MTTGEKVAAVAVGVVAVIIAAIVVIGAVVTSGKVQQRHTTDAEYCTLVKTKSLSDLVGVAQTTPAYTDTVLAMMPNAGPDPVAKGVVVLRDQLGRRDFVGATATARSLDALTPSVCPG